MAVLGWPTLPRLAVAPGDPHGAAERGGGLVPARPHGHHGEIITHDPTDSFAPETCAPRAK
eukprot:6205750-Pleurochrysis_carterae.AAC.1